MSVLSPEPKTLTSIVDNLGDNTLYQAIRDISGNGRELCAATAFFSLDALNLIGQHLHEFEGVRLLFGSDASHSQRLALLAAMRELSDKDLLKQREKDPLLGGLHHAKKLIEAGKLEARCYTRDKFHAKAYLAVREGFPPYAGIIGSGNFTRPGLTQNIELNVHLTHDQSQQLKVWFEERWREAEQDVVTDDIEKEIERHIRLYDPYAIYLKALLAWGDYIQGRKPLKPLEILALLDPHQEHAYRQALRILQREPGVMICDGVGLGKSFVALALMEHFLSEGSRVLLIAPKAILKSSWEGYLRRYLAKYSKGFANVHSKPMTWFGFNEEDLEDEETLKEYAEQADVILIDESHNFRNSATRRYKNLYRVVAPNDRGRKKVILLTATPVNTRYEDLSSQFQILTHDDGSISGIARLQLNKQARNRDREIAKKGVPQDQDVLFDYEGILADELLGTALESVAIQRSRHTCRELARAAGKQLRFPHRENPKEVRYALGSGHEALIREASLRFKELGQYLAAYAHAVTVAADKEGVVSKNFGKAPQNGLKFSGYLPNLFLRTKPLSNRQAQVEAFLARMVFVNVMKQLESSTPAFRSIIEALGRGLALRLRHYCGDEPKVESALRRHQAWIQLPANVDPDDPDLGEEPEDAAADEASGGETDEFICREERRAIKRLKALGFSRETHNIDRWRDDILNDLEHLQSVHDKCLHAQQEQDTKLAKIAEEIKAQRLRGHKVLVFTQSKKTADYIKDELGELLGETVALVTAEIGGDTRARILNAFSPKYNDLPRPKNNREMKPLPELDILVSTDVLAEGVNLQQAGCILNYDIHWNPTRLIQRIGRVDRRLRDEDPDHSFEILNVIPPEAIDEVIDLVNTVEQRKGKIDRLLGIDQSFFRAGDEGGTLKEFNRLYEGGQSPRETQLIEYVQKVNLSPEDRAVADALPPGAFGVWDGAPVDGVFVLYEMTADPRATPADRDHFRAIIGQPILAAEMDGKFTMDGPAILAMLSKTVKGERSGKSDDPEQIREALVRIKRKVQQSFRTINLSATIQPRLVCALELHKKP